MRGIVVIALLCATEALAHPDHGVHGWIGASLEHLFTEPDHLAMLLAPWVVAALAFGLRRRRRATRPISTARHDPAPRR